VLVSNIQSELEKEFKSSKPKDMHAGAEGIFIFGAHVLPSLGELDSFDSLSTGEILRLGRWPQAPTDVTVIDFRCLTTLITVDP
jgi:hypothetical protein